MEDDKKNKHSCFEWIHLVISISIPAVIAIYTVLENNRDLSIAAHNRAQDLEMADNELKDTILHEYQKTISKLIEKYGPQLNESESTSLVVRFSTLSALNQLDPDRRSFLIHLLYDTNLITYDSISDHIPVSLELANLTDLCLTDEFVGQIYTHISMECAIMTRADFHSIIFEGAIFNRAVLNNADFSNTTNYCVTNESRCFESDYASLYFTSADLTDAAFSGSIYERVNFRSSKMTNSELNSFVCISCVFTFAIMDRVDLRNAMIEKTSFVFVQFIKAKLDGSRFLENVDFHGADMSEVSATHIHFTRCQFEYTSIKNATFDYTMIEDSKFTSALLIGTSIRHSVLIRVNFTSAELVEGNWQNVRCEKCIFYNADFRNTDISNAIFIDSDFQNSTISEDQLNQAASLKGSILPNGTVINHK